MKNIRQLIYFDSVEDCNNCLKMCDKMKYCSLGCPMFDVFCCADIGHGMEIKDIIIGEDPG